MSDASLKKQRTPTAEQSALYTYDMLISLKRLAEDSKQARLAMLIDQAADEAQAVCRSKKY